MLSTGEEIRSPQRSPRSGPILAKMPCTTSIPVDNRPLASNWGIMKKNERCYLHSNT